jgi:hypothetical protein
MSLEILLLCCLATASISMTITRSSMPLFLPLRLKFKLFRCPYCMAHWVAFILSLSCFEWQWVVLATFTQVTVSSLLFERMSLGQQ